MVSRVESFTAADLPIMEKPNGYAGGRKESKLTIRDYDQGAGAAGEIPALTPVPSIVSDTNHESPASYRNACPHLLARAPPALWPMGTDRGQPD